MDSQATGKSGSVRTKREWPSDRVWIRAAAGRGKYQVLRPEQVVEALSLEGLQMKSHGDRVLLQNQFSATRVNGHPVNAASNVLMCVGDNFEVPSGQRTIQCQVVDKTS